MNVDEQEIEAKFYVGDLELLASRLDALGANLTQERVLEHNLRFDTPAGDLARARQVLRLRFDTRPILTYKGAAKPGEAVSMRQEIELTVSDFTTARHFLEALGYQVVVEYEKYRTTYHWSDLEVVLDEMPFGNFIEIEGRNAAGIENLSTLLGLDWSARCTESYLALFERLKAARQLTARNLLFAELEGIEISPQDLGLRPAAL